MAKCNRNICPCIKDMRTTAIAQSNWRTRLVAVFIINPPSPSPTFSLLHLTCLLSLLHSNHIEICLHFASNQLNYYFGSLWYKDFHAEAEVGKNRSLQAGISYNFKEVAVWQIAGLAPCFPLSLVGGQEGWGSELVIEIVIGACLTSWLLTCSQLISLLLVHKFGHLDCWLTISHSNWLLAHPRISPFPSASVLKYWSIALMDECLVRWR